MSVSIAIETPLQDDVRTLVAALNETTLKLTPREHTHHMTVGRFASCVVALLQTSNVEAHLTPPLTPPPLGAGGLGVAPR